ncbi:MAG: class IV adenylate cyclase [Candidatus Bathyarchaeota archaeon]|nr:class IV adenylate cyclase [Candidatus Bathyarchaeota archaeon]MDH5495188.1 class IV adenylate cyclase [Candidatus Bathyarchaeota archaeon]
MVELKAKVDGLETIRDKLIQYSAKQVGTFHQIDTYYKVPKGRLKLREVEGKSDAELIYYERENVAEPKRSSVFILIIPQPQVFRQILERIMKIKVVVDKVREIYFYEGIQIHLDIVEGSGSFIEFERITSQDSEQQKKDLSKLEKLREKLNISPQSLERLSYSGLI